ncbi:DUF3500 domain-containing protein [Cryptosporangium sp. NPDC048952]|uniref:DUF3500 domain-containing protein n=1 Tax=Cryptosporangium sp. NPDC048952 TaxID=3363961 RepID=UPI00371A802F
MAACGSTSDSASTTATAASSTSASAAAGSATPQIVTAAEAFLATLDSSATSKLVLDHPGDTTATAKSFSGRVGEQFGTAVWSNYPISDVIRQGLRLGDLSAAQRKAAMAVLASALSADGYTKVQRIMAADQVLSDSGTNYECGQDNYVITFVGTPSKTDRWMLEFGGHHLGLNVTIEGDQQTMAPTLTGCQPSSFTGDGATVHPLGIETDTAFALSTALSDAQFATALLTPAVTDLVLGPGKDGQKLAAAGIAGSAMTAAQRALLLKLAGAWIGMLNDTAAATQLALIEKDLPDTYFAWSGETKEDSSVYFRITGPSLIIEYADQGSMGGGPGGGTGVQAGGANHIHTVYRDPTNEYGRGFA